MKTKKIRYSELCYRLVTIKSAKETLEEEMKNKAMTMLAKAFDGDHEDKQVGTHALLIRWIKEIESEIEELAEEISEDVGMDIYNKVAEQEESK